MFGSTARSNGRFNDIVMSYSVIDPMIDSMIDSNDRFNDRCIDRSNDKFQ